MNIVDLLLNINAIIKNTIIAHNTSPEYADAISGNPETFRDNNPKIIVITINIKYITLFLFIISPHLPILY